MQYQIEKLNEASVEKPAKILICVFDRENAIFALMRQYGFEVISEIQGQVQKKSDADHVIKDFCQELVKQMENYDSKSNFNSIIAGSPAFFKTELSKKLTDSLKKKVIFGTCSSVSKSGINELLKPQTILELIITYFKFWNLLTCLAINTSWSIASEYLSVKNLGLIVKFTTQVKPSNFFGTSEWEHTT